jgi:hypothetical protein
MTLYELVKLPTERLMKIAKHPVIGNWMHASNLPAFW